MYCLGLHRPLAAYSLCYYLRSHIWSSKQGSPHRLVIQTPLHPNKEFIMAMMIKANFLDIFDTPISQPIPSCPAWSFIVLQSLWLLYYRVKSCDTSGAFYWKYSSHISSFFFKIAASLTWKIIEYWWIYFHLIIQPNVTGL